MSEVKEIKKRIDFLDYLKAICVIMVFITHFDWGDMDATFFSFVNSENVRLKFIVNVCM